MRGRKLKYGNKKVEYEGITFDSERERDRYIFLKQKEKEGLISDLVLQPKFEILPNQYRIERREKKLKTKTKIENVKVLLERSLSYIADFQYILNSTGEKIVEDVKISYYLKPVEFKIKKKLVLYVFEVQVREVYTPTQELGIIPEKPKKKKKSKEKVAQE